MHATRSTDVLVVGAGPVGLALAVGLARSGANCLVVERDSDFRDRGVRGKGVNPRTLEVFDDLGVVDEIYARGDLNLKIRTYEGSRLVHEVDPAPANLPAPDRPHAGVVLLAQHHTEAVLRDRLAAYGVKVELDTELTGCAQNGDEVIATVHRGHRTEQIRARYLVGCDGGRSTVRKLTGIPFLGETWDEERFLLGSMRIEGLAPEALHIWNHPQLGAGALALVPLRQDDSWAVHASVSPDEQGELPVPSLDEFRRLFAERAGLPGVRLHDLTWASVWRPSVRMVEQYRSGRVFLAGDAAHCHSAAGGQGMNTGIQDAHNLGWKLAAALRGAPDSLLDSYQAERLPVARAVLAATSAQHRALFSGGGARALADQMVNLANTAGADFTGLSVGYRGGPLGRDLDDTTGIRAGDRAPDAPCLTPDGPTRLFDLFRGPHFTLLTFADRAAPVPVPAPLPLLPGLRQATVHDPDGHAHRAYGLTGTPTATVLVRPDGYVALTAGATHPAELTTHLSEFAIGA
ncbi:FAD-dependent monooxygenase [Kitasatospora sp. MAP5-34]|uniref:FAD-dependent monooxygenase n=1 Tax=Kitasatospora sp. MAP5-34 TaxID=3035102 RepID=UPI002474D3BD|nr:FAD-dependent monooxygenase [Kitasatospora sp. MAP5-34]MDH6578152.1 2-polyprenyl-6-methoxyphenol hydroxylase-like FAD-dependent oxidoreductase [Kitasatospora sp. MAP5-34]